MTRFMVKVTQKHIDQGEKASCPKCPIALALQDRGFPNAEVGSWTWHLGGWNLGRGGNLSRRATDFVAAFDTGRSVTPTTFNLVEEWSGDHA